MRLLFVVTFTTLATASFHPLRFPSYLSKREISINTSDYPAHTIGTSLWREMHFSNAEA